MQSFDRYFKHPFVFTGLLLAIIGWFIFPSEAHKADNHGLPDFTSLVQERQSSVVNISAIKQATSRPVDPRFEEWLRRFRAQPRGGDRLVPESRSLGSGFILSTDGYIVTNAHVVEDTTKIIVRLSDRRELTAKIVGIDTRSDIALVKVEAQGLSPVRIGRSKDVQVGEWVLAIGSPFDFDHSVTSGIVSALQRSLPTEDNANYVPFIQTDVAINPGNSGGPLFNLKGEVIGVNSQIYTRTGSYIGLSFAIPIDIVMEVVEQIKISGRVSRGWLGVSIQEVSAELAESFELKKPQGSLISQVFPDTAADEAGLRVGDIVVSANNEEVKVSGDLPHIVGRIKPGTKIPIKVIREGKPIRLQVVLGELPGDQTVANNNAGPEDKIFAKIGLQVRVLTDYEREQLRRLGWSNIGGLRVERVSNAVASNGRIRAGDFLVAIGNVKVSSLAELQAAIHDLRLGQKVPAYIIRGTGATYVPLQILADERR